MLQGFDALEAYVAALPQRALNRGVRRSLLAKLESAEQRYRRGLVCPAYNVMGAYLSEVQSMRWAAIANPSATERAALAEELNNRGRALRDSFFDVFLEDPSLVPPRPCFDPALRRDPLVTVLASDNTRFSARVAPGRCALCAAG